MGAGRGPISPTSACLSVIILLLLARCYRRMVEVRLLSAAADDSAALRPTWSGFQLKVGVHPWFVCHPATTHREWHGSTLWSFTEGRDSRLMPVESHGRREVDNIILLVLSPRGVQKLLQSGSYILQVMFFLFFQDLHCGLQTMSCINRGFRWEGWVSLKVTRDL